jgi:NTE family protein
MSSEKSFSLALGAGGARGLAHLKMLEVLDRHRLKPCGIAGASIGALAGALYASGNSSQSIQDLVDKEWLSKLPEQGGFLEKILKPLQTFRWVKPNPKGSSALQADKIIDFLISYIGAENFEDLQIPLQVVATDYWTGEEVLLNSGPLKPALMATMAIPGIFPPVELGDRLLLDGGYSNGLPVSLLSGHADLSLAIDVPLTLVPESGDRSGLTEFSQNMVDRLLSQNIQHRLQENAPDIYLSCPIQNIGILSFEKIKDVSRQAEPACRKLEQELRTHGLIH